ncbi:hypothetical protein P43SY_010096 [Pythium insidiosum]|uniref:WW domain-containing protein n=1 Tax=Pythium insidiosum TaxID=114742 RepID=A0AAD5LQI0_PYTIN|nr:hypothetical protein P43SY_010096 [Pythium insidiosum]
MVRKAYQKVYDPDSKQYFYFNRHTKQSQWCLPPTLEKASALHEQLSQRLRKQPSEQTLAAAATRIQSLFRKRAARLALRRLLTTVYEKVYDPETRSYFYFCKQTNTSSWDKPRLLRDDDLSPAQEAPRDAKQHEAARKIQTLFRNRATRVFLRDLALGYIEKHFDDDSKAWYYFNHRTNQSFWERPRHAALSP